MTTKLWQISGIMPLHPAVEAYTVGDDIGLDQRLLGYDILASQAHARMLQSVGVLTMQEATALLGALDQLREEWRQGTFTIGKSQEDCHTAIEAYLVERLGDVGKKIHTARSRNDQAATMMRLYLKESLRQGSQSTGELIKTLRKASKKAGGTQMPGYTHLQKALPTTVSSWLESYAEAFTDAKRLTDHTLRVIDQNPLGSAAGFDMTLSIDRSHTTKSLGFAKIQKNPMYCGFSRGFFELMAVQTLNPLMVLAGKFAHDMLLFTTEEFGFFSLPDEFTTGSSIMPHKHNYDVFELMRGKAHVFSSHAQQLQAILGGLGSGYQRDLQLTKGITVEAFDTAQETLDILCLIIPELSLHKERLSAAITPEMHSVAKIHELISQGIPFRDAYLQVKQTLEKQRPDGQETAGAS